MILFCRLKKIPILSIIDRAHARARKNKNSFSSVKLMSCPQADIRLSPEYGLKNERRIVK